MRITAGLTLTFLVVFYAESVGQELKLIRKRVDEYLEEYTVLKENKKIRHGQYIRFRINSFGQKSIDIIGFYNHGLKAHNWLYFSHRGYLKKEGKYLNDLEEGLWTEYIEPIPKSMNTMEILNSGFEVNKGIYIKENGDVEINRLDIIKVAEGNYHRGLKVGSWLYYSSKGNLIHNYDHSSDSVLVNNSNDKCPYLGGYERFVRDFMQFKLYGPVRDSEILFQIPLDSRLEPIKTISCIGDCTIIDKLKDILSVLRKEFIRVEGGQVKVNFKFKINDGGLFDNLKIAFE
jgi:hypothetical protein